MDMHAEIGNRSKLFMRIAVLAGCATLGALASGCSVMAPEIEKATAENRSELIVGCSNVARGDDSRDFITDSYLTTWMSALKAGGAQGLYEGLEDAPLGLTDQERKELVFSRLPESAMFCRRFEAHPSAILSIVERMLPQYGYEWNYINRDDGLLRSRFVHRAAPAFGNTVVCDYDCDAINPNRKWRDRYLIDIKLNNSGGSDVRVHREVRISRPMDGGWSDYQLNQSVGHNEAVILDQIARALESLQVR